jgi:protein tyrosine phosphatase
MSQIHNAKSHEYQRLEEISPKFYNCTSDNSKALFMTALTASCQHKNRYPDILPFEKSRVRLSPNLSSSASEGSDYINASLLMDGAYISCQAPVFSTFADFWRMVWEQQSHVIVMLTRLYESGKCKAHPYWPIYQEVGVRFGNITVTLIDERNEIYFTIRRFLLESAAGELREVFHFHYTEWPDFGVPASTKGIRTLVQHVELYSGYIANSAEVGPIIVHCSAGIGRSGSFIAIHYNFVQQMSYSHDQQQEDGPRPINVFDTVLKMRSERVGMVQTAQQYEFIYQALEDFIVSESTPEFSSSSEEEYLVDEIVIRRAVSDCHLSQQQHQDISFPSVNSSSESASVDWRRASSATVNTLRVSTMGVA